MLREYKLLYLCALVVTALTAPAASAQFSISGTVRDNLSAPVVAVNIRLFDSNDNPIGIPPIQTDVSGFYIISGLPSGDYLVQYDPPTATRLLAMREPVTINGSNTTRNVTLQPGNLLSGHVRDIDGIGIPDIDLQVYERGSGDLVLTPGDDTDATGFYDVVVPDGEFDLEWRAVAPGSPPYIRVSLREVIESDTVIDVTMVIGFFVSGIVRDSGGQPVANVNMDFVDADTGVKLDTPGDSTDLTGFYEVHIPAGTYIVRAKPRVEDRLAAGELTDVVIIGDTTAIDFVLLPGVILSGRVTGSSAGGVAGVDIDVADATTGADIFLAFDNSDDLGFYTVVIPPGLVVVTFEPPVATMLAPVQTDAMSIMVDTQLDMTLPNGVQLSGSIQDNLGNPVAGTDIDARDPVTGQSVPLVGDSTDGAGNFAVILVPGVYHLEFEPPKVLGLVAEQRLSQNIAGNTVVNVTLQPGARITGTVTNPVGQVVVGVDVDVLTLPSGQEIFTPADNTNDLGQYEIIIPPDTYRFLFRPGLANADLDSLELNDVIISGDQVIDVQLPFSSAVAVGDEMPDQALLAPLRNYPNPFNPATEIRFRTTADGPVDLAIYDTGGRLVRRLVSGHQRAGETVVIWDGRDGQGRNLATGTYLAVLRTAEEQHSHKLTLVK